MGSKKIKKKNSVKCINTFKINEKLQDYNLLSNGNFLQPEIN